MAIIGLDKRRTRTMLLVDPPKDSPEGRPSYSGVWTPWDRTKHPTPEKMGEGGGFADARGERPAKIVVARGGRRPVGRT